MYIFEARGGRQQQQYLTYIFEMVGDELAALGIVHEMGQAISANAKVKMQIVSPKGLTSDILFKSAVH